MSEKEKMIKEMLEAHAKEMIQYQNKAIETYESNDFIKNFAEGYIAGINCVMSAFKFFSEYAERYFPNEAKK